MPPEPNAITEFLWGFIGCIGATAKYFNDVANHHRPFITTEFLLLITSGGFAAWLIAKTSVVFFAVSVDAGFIISGVSGVLGFGATVNVLDNFISKRFK
jgi:hypothetical protein